LLPRCQGADCEPGNFEAVASAFELLSDAEARREYERHGRGVHPSAGGPHGGSAHGGRRRGNAGSTFDDMFGGGWRDWSPGDHVTYVHVRNGKTVKLEIFSDGTTVESEGPAASSTSGGYSKTTRTSGGQRSVHVQIDGVGSLEPLLVAAGVPALAAAGLTGLLSLLCSPGVLFLSCVFCACGPSRHRRPRTPEGGGGGNNPNSLRTKAD
jgi:hypothetical protein